MENNNAPRIPDFNMLRRIGGGSYGVVWIARSLTGIYRAVKVVERARFADARPFLRELDGITRFQQTVGNEPRQLALMHVGRDDDQGIFYYVMELADDVDSSTDIDPESYTPLTLKALRERRQLLPAAECVRLGIELARALAGLHAAGLIHRDVKPSNIIFVNGVPKLADVGLVSSSDHTLTSLGTPGYAPPEGAGTMESDVYGLGKILYELATGCPTSDFPRLPAEVTTREDTPLLLELNEVLLRACHPDPSERYPAAQAMLDDLLLLQAGKSVKELVRTKHRLKLLVRVSGIAAIIALGALGVLGWKYYLAAKRLAEKEVAARQQAEADERLARYSADLHLAQLALNGGDYGVARSALRRQIPAAGEPDLRDVEWQMLWSDTEGDQARLLGSISDGAARDLILSQDERLAVVQRVNGRVEVWDLTTGQQRSLHENARGLGGFSRDGGRFYVGTPERTVRILNLDDGSVIGELSVRGRLISTSLDGQQLALGEVTTNGPIVRVWNKEADSLSGEWQAGLGSDGSKRELSAAALNRNGSLLAVAVYDSEPARSTRSVILWNVAERTELLSISIDSPVRSITFSPDSRLFAVARSDGTIEILATSDGQRVHRLEATRGRVSTVAFSSDGSQVAAGALNGELIRWTLANGTEQPLVQRGHEAGLTALSWLVDRASLWSASDDGTLRLWDQRTHGVASTAEGFWSGAHGNLLLSSDGERMAVTNAIGQLALVSVDNFEVLRGFPEVFQPLAWPLGGELILAQASDGALQSVNVADGTVTRISEIPGKGEALSFVSATPDAQMVAFGFVDGDVAVWRANDRNIVRFENAGGSIVRALAIDEKTSWVASGHRDGTVVLWNPATGHSRTVSAAGKIPVKGILATSENTLAVGFEDGKIVILDVAGGSVLKELVAHSKPVTQLTLSPSGERLLSGDTSGYIVSWTTDSWRAVATIEALPQARPGTYPGIYRAQFAQNNSRFSALTEDGQIRSWRLLSNKR